MASHFLYLALVSFQFDLTPSLLDGEPKQGNPEIDILEGRRVVHYGEPDRWSGDLKSLSLKIGFPSTPGTWRVCYEFQQLCHIEAS
jgi:hypothetical protein